MTLFQGVIYIMVLMMIFLGVVLHESDVENNTERNIFNYTEAQFGQWNSSQWESKPLNNTNLSMSEVFSFRVRNMIFKTVDLVGYSLFQGIKLGIEFGYEKAYAYEPERFISLAKVILIVVMIGFIVPIIIPVLALLYLLFEGLKWLIDRFNKNERRKKDV